MEDLEAQVYSRRCFDGLLAAIHLMPPDILHITAQLMVGFCRRFPGLSGPDIGTAIRGLQV